MAKPPRLSAPKIKYDMSPKAVLGRAERVQRIEAGESRMARSMPTKKPATLTMPGAAAAATRATLARAERIQREEAGERAIMQRKSPDIIRTTVRMKETPNAKKQALEAAVRSGKATPARMPSPNVGSGSKMKPARMPTPNVDSMVKRPSSGPFSGKMTPARMPDKTKKGK